MCSSLAARTEQTAHIVKETPSTGRSQCRTIAPGALRLHKIENRSLFTLGRLHRQRLRGPGPRCRTPDSVTRAVWWPTRCKIIFAQPSSAAARLHLMGVCAGHREAAVIVGCEGVVPPGTEQADRFPAKPQRCRTATFHGVLGTHRDELGSPGRSRSGPGQSP